MSNKGNSAPYVCVVKICNRPNGSAYCIKYHVNNLLKFTRFLDRQWPVWKWFNVFDNHTALQVTSFTNRRKPLSPKVTQGDITSYLDLLTHKKQKRGRLNDTKAEWRNANSPVTAGERRLLAMENQLA